MREFIIKSSVSVFILYHMFGLHVNFARDPMCLCLHDSMDRPKIEFITYIYIFYHLTSCLGVI